MKDNETEQLDPAETQPMAKPSSQTIGQTLKQSRIEQNIEIEQVCNQLKLSSHVIEALESDNYENLPEIAYIRGYIVSYCRLLGLDSFFVLKQLVSDDPSLSISNSITSGIGSTTASNNQSQISKLLLLPLLLAIVLGAGFWFYTQNSDYSTSSKTQTNTADLNGQTSDEVQNSTASTNNVPATNNESITLNPAVNEAVADDQKQLLELEFDAVSWVDIENSNKERIVYKSFPRGEKYQVKAALPLNIFIDNASGVSLSYEGRLIDLTPYIKEGYAKFTLGE